MFFFFSSRRRHTRLQGDWSSDVCSSDLWRYDFVRQSAACARIPEHGADVKPSTPPCYQVSSDTSTECAHFVRTSYNLSVYDLPDFPRPHCRARRSEEHTSELQSPCNLVCRLLLE